MQKAYLNLVKYALAQGCTVSVYDGEEWQVRRGTGYQAIVGAIESVEEADLIIRDAQDYKVAWVKVIPFGLEPDETVADYSDNAWMAAWEAQYPAFN